MKEGVLESHGMVNRRRLSVIHDPSLRYPEVPPFSPSERYLEYPFEERLGDEPSEGSGNPAYAAIRQALYNLGLDWQGFGRPEWNPFGEFIRPGQKVLLKPNFVKHKPERGGDQSALVTSGSVIRAALDYVFIALRGEGEIVIGDAPIQSADFEEIVRLTGLDKIADFYRTHTSVKFTLQDFRVEVTVRDEENVVLKRIIRDHGDYQAVDLGDRSLLMPVIADFERFRVTNYDPKVMRLHHSPERNEYLIHRTVLDSDVVINLPKLKSHRKAGVTGAIKNVVGINASKDWLPHHRKGAKFDGGDEYAKINFLKSIVTTTYELQDTTDTVAGQYFWRLLRGGVNLLLRGIGGDPYREGSWWGNDTLWRMVLDLQRILKYAGRDGQLKITPQREHFILLDGIIGGEGEGPLKAKAKHSGLLVAGFDPVLCDLVCAMAMGFDYRNIPIIARAIELKDYPVTDGLPAQILLNGEDISLDEIRKRLSLDYLPPAGWKGVIESAEEQSLKTGS